MSEYSAKFPLDFDFLISIFPTVGRRGKINKEKNLRGFIYTFNKYADYFGIDTPLETCHFVAQIAHESDQFNAYSEYASGAAYEGKKDLGNIYKGDGVKFKGGGPLQITGRRNYIEAGDEILKLPFLSESERKLFENNGILKNPRLLEDPVWGTLSALIYWTKKDLNSLCKPDGSIVTIKRYSKGRWYNYNCSPLEAITRKINGGVNGFDERKLYYSKLKKRIL